ncbi:hypothetical protein PLUA15_210001 [Pseudomonas lundensis]|uniref:Uncharacterized protein n=1 Tax=Pseudomonas lundensis TaxID=86185 RepID=A0AAX2H4Y4_9PSED|nr:hypothetical protein PLUA15_210001 [Pseudomonas lundensis]
MPLGRKWRRDFRELSPPLLLAVSDSCISNLLPGSSPGLECMTEMLYIHTVLVLPAYRMALQGALEEGARISTKSL